MRVSVELEGRIVVKGKGFDAKNVGICLLKILGGGGSPISSLLVASGLGILHST